MPAAAQEVRYASTADSVRIAYTATGSGYPLVRAVNWMTVIEHDWKTPIWQPWFERLSRRYRLLRYDSRACGLSDRGPYDIDLESMLRDLDAVVNAAGVERFALLGISQGGAVSIAYAAQHPERVSHLVLCGAYARGALVRNPTQEEIDAVDAMIKLIEVGWGQKNSAFLQLFTSQFFPGATPEQTQAFNEIQRLSTSPSNAARIARALSHLDASAFLPSVRCPTLVLHCTGDARVPFEEGRYIAASIAGARFEPIDSVNHVPLSGEPGFEAALAAIERFLPSPSSVSTAFEGLTPRERTILELIARGLDNSQIAAHLGLSEKTVRNRITGIFDKLEVDNRARAIVLAREAGFGAPGR